MDGWMDNQECFGEAIFSRAKPFRHFVNDLGTKWPKWTRNDQTVYEMNKMKMKVGTK